MTMETYPSTSIVVLSLAVFISATAKNLLLLCAIVGVMIIATAIIRGAFVESLPTPGMSHAWKSVGCNLDLLKL